VLERRRADEPRQARPDFLARDRHPRAAVLDVVRELARHAGRAHRHHHRVGAQNRKGREQELRAVLQVDQHPVAGPHAAGALQEARQAQDLLLGLAVRERGAEEPARGLVGIAPRGHLEQLVQRRARKGKRFRQALGPEAEVAQSHTWAEYI
jgi:hypothetical protein